jgi:hypothetical protein
LWKRSVTEQLLPLPTESAADAVGKRYGRFASDAKIKWEAVKVLDQ